MHANPTPHVTYTPAPKCPPLVAVSTTSFQCNPADLPDVFAWLCQIGYTEKAPATEKEYWRVFDRGALLVCYRSGRIVAQGSEANRAANLLRRHCTETATLPLVWHEGGAR